MAFSDFATEKRGVALHAKGSYTRDFTVSKFYAVVTRTHGDWNTQWLESSERNGSNFKFLKSARAHGATFCLFACRKLSRCSCLTGQFHFQVHDNDQAILCESGCNFWFHRICTGLSDAAYQMLTTEVYAEWVCDKCLGSKQIPLVKMKP